MHFYDTKLDLIATLSYSYFLYFETEALKVKVYQFRLDNDDNLDLFMLFRILYSRSY